MLRFVCIDLARELALDAAKFCRFRHQLEAHILADQLFALINSYLQENGLKMGIRTIVDATIIEAPSFLRIKTSNRGSEVHHTKKVNRWCFGIKVLIGACSQIKLIHSVASAVANMQDSKVIPELLHDKETHVWSDSSYT